MFKLNYRINDKFVVNGVTYTANASFDNILRLLEMFKEETISNNKKVSLGIKILFGKDTDLTKLTVKEQIELLNSASERYIEQESKFVERDILGNPMPVQQKAQLYSLEKDAEYIFSSFLQAYKLNLFEQHGKLHWYEFQALLGGLPDDTKFRQVLDIRQWEPTKGTSAETREKMRELQRIYSLDGQVQDDTVMGGD